MRSVLIFLFAAQLAAVAVEGQEPQALNQFVVRTRMPLEARTLKGAPYSAEVVTDHTQTLADGNRIVEHSTGRVYRDKEGRVRREEDRASGGSSISIVDPVAGVSYSLDPERHIAWKTPMQTGVAIMNKVEAAKTAAETMAMEVNGGAVALRRSRGGEQRKEDTLAPRTMEGVRAEGHRTTTTIVAGAIGNEWPITIVSEEWTSPELQVLVLTDRKDPRNGDSSYRLLGIVRGEPSAALFQVPPDYEVKETGIRRFEVQRER
jgi:hypothetical protein